MNYLILRWEFLKDKVKTDYGDYSDYYVNWVEEPGYDSFVCADGQKGIHLFLSMNESQIRAHSSG